MAKAQQNNQQFSIATIASGTTVRATDGVVGTVEQVLADETTGEATRLLIRTEAGERVEVPVSLIDAASTTNEVRLLASRQSLAEGYSALEEVGDRIVVPVREEVLIPTARPVELGQVRIHKRIEELPAEGMAELQRDDVQVTRVPIGRPIDAVPAPRNEGETLIIPVVEEELVTTKRLVLREEIRVTRRRVTERVPVQGTVRREVVEIEEAVVPEAAATQGPVTHP